MTQADISNKQAYNSGNIMNTIFYGRKHELSALREENWREKSLLAAVYGRRRVGKTSLVEFAYKDDILWKFEGIENGSTRTQIRYFLKQLSQSVCPECEFTASDWDEAFSLLDKQILKIEKTISRRLVIFFDEFQWLCEMKSGLVSLFKYHWDNFLSKHPKCTFILCGSISSFIVKKVLYSKALYGRVNLEINLQPLSVQESQLLLKDSLCQNNVLDVHMVLGGVPQYLLELNPRMSLVQNLNEYAFKPTGFFFNEFNRLFISHFAGHAVYEKILCILSQGRLPVSDLSKKCKITSGGSFTERLREMELAGFIQKQVPVDKGGKSRLQKYCINDEFLHFYFKFIAPNSHNIINGRFSFQSILKSRDYAQWQGFAFERLCRKHAAHIAEHQRFSGIDYKAGSWFKRKSSRTAGVQVDLIFIRSDNVITVCEIKYASRIQAAAVIDNFEKKCRVLQKSFTSYVIEKVLIIGKTDSKNEKLHAYFDHVLKAEDLFANPAKDSSLIIR